MDAVGLHVKHLSSLVPVVQRFQADADPGIVWDDEGADPEAEGLTQAERLLGQLIELNGGQRIPWLNIEAERQGIIISGGTVLDLLQSLDAKAWVYMDEEQRWWARGSM